MVGVCPTNVGSIVSRNERMRSKVGSAPSDRERINPGHRAFLVERACRRVFAAAGSASRPANPSAANVTT